METRKRRSAETRRPRVVAPFPHFPTFLLLVAIFSGWVYLSGVTGPVWAHVLSKTLPVLCLALWAWPGRRAVALGLLASALGDAFLDAGAAWFLAGMVAFLSAHVFYVFAFVCADKRLRPAHALPFLAWAVAAYMAVRANVGGMAVPVIAYVTVICAMMWRAAAQAWPSPKQTWAWLGCMGALMFGASDTLLALARWRPGFAASGLASMLLYWGGQALIAAWGRVKFCRPFPPEA